MTRILCITICLFFHLCNFVHLKVHTNSSSSSSLSFLTDTTSSSSSSLLSWLPSPVSTNESNETITVAANVSSKAPPSTPSRSTSSSSLLLSSSSSSSSSSSLSENKSYPLIVPVVRPSTTLEKFSTLNGTLNKTENRELAGLFDLLQERELGDLLLIQTIITVTDQAPRETYKDCPYQGHWRRIGRSNITPFGIKKIYQLGKYFQRRYKPYLEGITAKNIIAASGDTRAEEETNLAFLAGCCKPSQQNVWSYMDGLFPFWWQPIGVARLSPLNYHSNCPNVEKIEQTPEMLPEIREFLVENSEFITRILPFINHRTSRNESLLYKMAWIAEGMMTEEKYFGSKWKQPDWINYAGENGLQKFKSLWNLLIQSSQYYSSTYVQMKMGPLFKILLSNMIDAAKLKSSQNPNRRKFFSFTTNQYIMNLLMQTMDIYKEIPAKASGIVFEIRRHTFYEEPLIYLYFIGFIDSPNMRLIPIGDSEPFKDHCLLNFCPLSGFIKSLAKHISNNPNLCKDFQLKPIEKKRPHHQNGGSNHHDNNNIDNDDDPYDETLKTY